MLQDMQDRLDALPPERSHRQFFLGTYVRTTRAVGDAVETGRFQDPTWVVRWDVAFADLYLTAHDADTDGRRVPRPGGWRSPPTAGCRPCATFCSASTPT